MRKRIGIVVLLAVAAAGVAVWWSQGREAEREGVLNLYGNVDLREIDLAFEDVERIARVAVEEGDRVDAGDLLAELESDRLLEEIARAQGQSSAQEHVVERLVNGTRKEDIDATRAELRAAEVGVRNAERTFERIDGLAGTGAVMDQDVDDARAAMDSARARRDVASERLKLALAGARREDIAAARATLAARRAELGLLQRRLGDARLRAPASGVVRNRILEAGEIASPQRPVVTIALDDPKWVRAYVAGTDLGRIAPGMRAEVSTDTFPERAYAGRVGFISPTAEFTPKSVETTELRSSLVYEVRIVVEDPHDELRLGMPATVKIATGGRDASAAGGVGAPTSEETR